ncbi:WD repeat and HMG-box DNA-binding protein 1-like protein [Dinothrombium tinctorium]|uniref:WD repeat and HMG-box DNA-binding protein 1-like protein n=1 Tax=Dinothrombium tinctorium TaxID=1965070 RepID=A0A3S3P087_9ACAR|nr:WD repeat and HMG-box DNA-binding protein 1-like protein [Dinothrombium tinctorium]
MFTKQSFTLRHLVTGGIEGDVRYWSLQETDSEPKSFDVDSAVYAVAIQVLFAFSSTFLQLLNQDSKFYVATESNELRCFSLNEDESETTVTRFTAGIYHLDLSRDGKCIAAGGGDFLVKLINLSDSSQITLSGHEAPILCVAFDPQNLLIASSSCDGTVRLWNIEEKKCVHLWNNHPKSNEITNSPTLCQICWDQNGNLIVPAKDNINVYERNSWGSIRTFRYEEFTDISICSLSPDDEYLAASNTTGAILIWKFKTDTSTPIASFVHSKKIAITGLKWNPTVEHSLSFCDSNGELHFLSVKMNKTKDESSFNYLLEEVLEDDDDLMKDLNEYENKQHLQISHPIPQNDTNSAVDEFEADVNDDDDENEIDIGAIKAKYEPKIFSLDEDEEIKNKSDENDKVKEVGIKPKSEQELENISTIKVPKTHIQPAFQPGSTPSDFQHRFLVWNSIGIVISSNTDEENSIDVEFHDVNIYHSIHFANTYNYVIADLSSEALLCANQGDELSKSSRLFCMNFSTWDSNKEWKYDLPNDECVLSLALGSGFAAIATDQHYLRLFTVSGIQLHVLSLFGSPVCVSAQEKSLVIMYHNGHGLPGEQAISSVLYTVDLKTTFLKKKFLIPVAISPKSSLSWAGFTDEGTACTMDTAGVIRLYKNFSGDSWIPILQTKSKLKNKSDNYFIIGLSEIQQQVRCVLCKGSRYPLTIPRPTLLLLDFQLPLCEMSTTRSLTEEQFLRLKITNSLLLHLSKEGFDVDFQVEDSTSKITATLLKLFALALGDNSECLALEIANLMPNKSSLELAIRYALQRKKMGLTKKIAELVEQNRDSSEAVGDGDEFEEEIGESFSKHNSHKESEVTRSKSDIVIKPKPIKKSSQKASSNDDDSASKPKPKPVKSSVMHSTNPFKISTDGESRGKSGFELFFDAMKEQIAEQYPEIEDEDEMRAAARDMFDDLSNEEKKKWHSSAVSLLKRKADETKGDSKKTKIDSFLVKRN